MSEESSFKSHFIISELNNNWDDFKSILSVISKQEYMWKPAPDKWCLLEIVCHLYDIVSYQLSLLFSQSYSIDIST